MTLFNLKKACAGTRIFHSLLTIVAVPWLLGVALHAQDGNLDTSFSADGQQVISSNLGGDNEDVITDLLVDPDNKIVAAGYSSVSASGDQDFEIYRFKENGDLDTLNFGPVGGRAPVFFDVFGTLKDRAYAVDRDPSGRYFVAGTAEVGAGGDYSVAVAKLNVNGTLETTWGTGGKVLIPVGGVPSYDQAVGIKVLSDFSVIIGAYTETGGTASFAFIKLDDHGDLDTTFGSSGIKIITIASHAVLRAIAVQGDGKVIGVGEIYHGADAEFLAVRLTAAGQLDNSFDGDGFWEYGFDNGTEVRDVATAVVVQNDGKILIAGTISASSTGDRDFGLVRLTSSGLLDPSFDSDGLLEISVGSMSDAVTDLKVLADGKIFVAGYKDFGVDSDFAIQKLHSNGSADSSFGTAGFKSIAFDLGGGFQDRANAMAFDSNNRLVIGGFAEQNAGGHTDLALARVLNTLDAGFIFSDGFESGNTSAWSASAP